MNTKRQKIFDKSGGKCWYCGTVLPLKGWHADHLKPIRRNFDGKTSLHPERDTFDNLVPSCASCNINKHSMTVEQFRASIAKYIDSLNKYNTQYKVAKRYGLVKESKADVVFWFEREGVGKMSEKTVKIDPKQLFLSTSDIRNYLSVGISDYVISEIEREWGVDHDLIDDILNHAGIYVRQDLLPRHIEVKELE